LSKANQAMTSDLTPSAASTNINELRAKNPEPTHPDRDPTTQPASLIWPQKADTDAWWEEEDGQEYIQQHFNIKHIAQYFRTRSPVSAADIDGWRVRELMAPLFMGDDEELQGLIRTDMILPYLFGDFHPSHIQEYAGGLLLALEKPAKDGWGVRPIICGESWRRCFASLAPTLSGVQSLVFLQLHMKKNYTLQVSRTAPPTAPRFFPLCMRHLTLTTLTPT
jgi:hypothetical protein